MKKVLAVEKGLLSSFACSHVGAKFPLQHMLSNKFVHIGIGSPDVLPVYLGTSVSLCIVVYFSKHQWV